MALSSSPVYVSLTRNFGEFRLFLEQMKPREWCSNCLLHGGLSWNLPYPVTMDCVRSLGYTCLLLIEEEVRYQNQISHTSSLMRVHKTLRSALWLFNHHHTAPKPSDQICPVIRHSQTSYQKGQSVLDMSFPTKSVFIHRGDWDAETDSHPATNFLRKFANTFDTVIWSSQTRGICADNPVGRSSWHVWQSHNWRFLLPQGRR